MDRNDPRYGSYISILKEELIPAMGCTEPIALAYAAAKARAVLGNMPERIKAVDMELCLAAVQQCGYALEHVPEEMRSPGLCLDAVRSRGPALQYVPAWCRTADLCREAVEEDSWALEHVPPKLRTEALCLDAVARNPRVLSVFPPAKRTPALCLAAHACFSRF